MYVVCAKKWYVQIFGSCANFPYYSTNSFDTQLKILRAEDVVEARTVEVGLM